MNTDDLLDVARELIDRQTFCFAITVTSCGDANARIVQPRKLTQDWTVDFATRRTCRKYREIEASGKLTLAYQDDADRAYVTLVGRVVIDDDVELKRRRWNALTAEQEALAKRWNPGGPDDPEWLYIRLLTRRIELWSAARDVMPEPMGYSAAILERADPADAWDCSTS